MGPLVMPPNITRDMGMTPLTECILRRREVLKA
jgi:hypothetical protein